MIFRTLLSIAGLACAALPALAQSAFLMEDLMCGRTFHYHTPGIGNQIEYNAPDGTAYLWYPGAPDAIVGTWSVTPRGEEDAEICFQYPVAEVEGRFGDYDGAPICFNSGALLDDTPEDGVRDGDPYNLSSGEVPFVLPVAPYLLVEELRSLYPDTPRDEGCIAFTS